MPKTKIDYPDSETQRLIETIPRQITPARTNYAALQANIAIAALDGKTLRLTAGQQKRIFNAHIFGKKGMRFDLKKGAVYVLESYTNGGGESGFRERVYSFDAIASIVFHSQDSQIETERRLRLEQEQVAAR